MIKYDMIFSWNWFLKEATGKKNHPKEEKNLVLLSEKQL